MGQGLTKDDVRDVLEQAITAGKITPDLDQLIESFHKVNKTAIQAILKDIKEDDKNKIEKILNEQIKIVQESIIKDAEERHRTLMESKDAEKDRLKSDYEQALHTLKEEKKEERIWLLKEKETELMTLRAEIKEEKKRNEEAKTEIEKRMAEEKTTLMRANANAIQTRENYLKERENMMQITLQERLDFSIKEKEEKEKQYERLIHIMKEDIDKTKKEKDEQMLQMMKDMRSSETCKQQEIEKLKEEKEQMRQMLELEIQQIKEDEAKKMEQLKQDHKQSLESTHNKSQQEIDRLVTMHKMLMQIDQTRSQQFQEMMSHHIKTADYLMETNKIYQQVTLGVRLQEANRFSLLQQTRPCPGIGPSSISMPRAHLTHFLQDQQTKLKQLTTHRENEDNESATDHSDCIQFEMPPSASEESSPATWDPNAIPSGCETDDAAFKQHQTSDCQNPDLRTKHRQTDGKTPDVDNDSDSSKPFADTDEKLDVTNPQPHDSTLDSDQNKISPGLDTLGNNSSAIKSDNLNQRSVSVSENQDEHTTISVAVPMQRHGSQESGVPGNSSAAPESRTNESKEPGVSTAGTPSSMLEDKYDSFEVIIPPTSNDSSYNS